MPGFGAKPILMLSSVAVILSGSSSAAVLKICPTRTVTAETFGTIVSPGYPATYPSNINCALTLRVPDYFSTTIWFEAFSVKYSHGCRKDKLLITDGRRTVPRCGESSSRVPPPMTFNSREIKFIFTTTSAVGTKGFHINYNLTALPKKVPGENVCPTRTITAKSSGGIHSPQYPAKHSNNLNCVLTVQLPPNFMMTLWFDKFSLQYSRSCSKDKLVLSDDKTGGATFCGNGLPAPMKLHGHHVRISFTADASYAGAGFLLNYNLTGIPAKPTPITFPPISGVSVYPSRTLTAQNSGTIYSPQYPMNYGNNMNCVLTLRIPANFMITMWFDSFQMENSSSCFNDKLLIRDNKGASQVMCGGSSSSVFPPMKFYGSQVTLNFVTDGSRSGKGFLLRYNLTYLPIPVGGVSVFPTRYITAQRTGSIYSPQYPSNYGSNINSVLTLQVPVGFMITMWFDSFQMEDSSSCSKDKLLIKDNKGASQVMCGGSSSSVSPPMKFYGSQVTLNFVTDGSGSGKGFLLRYNLTAVPIPVGGVSVFPTRYITAQRTGSIYSPKYPSNYGSNINSVLTLQVPAGFMITMWFDSFQIEYSSSCSKDKLLIRDNKGASQVLCVGSSSSVPPLMKFYGSQVTLNFVTDGSGSGKGFLLRYNLTAVPISVGGVSVSPTRSLTAQRTGTVYSPQYPSNYPNNMNSVLTLQIPANNIITLWFDSFHMENSPSCSKDKLLIKDNKGSSRVMCGGRSSTIPPPMTFYGSQVTLNFVTDGSGSGKGFLVRYRLSAAPQTVNPPAVNGVSVYPTKTISAQTNGSIYSPQYPANYGNNLNSILTLQVPTGFMITLWFDSFQMEYSLSCSKDKLQISDNTGVLYVLCGKPVLRPMMLYGSQVTLNFVTGSSGRGGMFLLHYMLTALPQKGAENVCSSQTITARNTGDVSSPQYPSNYGDNLNCVFTIQIPANFLINLWFDSFAIEKSKNCAKDQLLVEDDLGRSHMLCGVGTLPPRMTFYGHQIKLSFRSDSSTNYKGFYLHYGLSPLLKGDCVRIGRQYSPQPSNLLAYIEAQDYGNKAQRMQNEIKFDFKTESDGVIAFAKAPKDSDYFYVGLEGGCLFYEANLGTGVGCAGVAGPNLKDNNWHSVIISRDGRRISIVVDEIHKRSGITPGAYSRLDFHATSGYMLGVPVEMRQKYPSIRLGGNFVGLIRGFSIDGHYPTHNMFSGAHDWVTHGKEAITLC